MQTNKACLDIMRIIFGLLLGFAFSMTAYAKSTEKKADIELGKSIFENGLGRDGRKINALNQYGIEVAMACSGCHGVDGRGGGEAFVRAPDIRWLSLTKPYGARNAGTQSAPYTFSSFSRVLRNGISSQGQKIDPIMPKMQLADDEIKSLVVYLEHLSDPRKAGVKRTSIVGLLPREGSNAMADDLAKRLRNCKSSYSAHSAVIDIIRFDQPSDAIEKINTKMAGNEKIVVLAPFLFGWERQYAEFALENKITTIMPVTLLDSPESPDWHYSLPGLESQIAQLLSFSANNGRSSVLIHYEKKDPLSLYLYQQSTALLKNFSLSQIDEQQKASTRYAELWLRRVPEEIYKPSENTSELHLIPASFSSYSPIEKSNHAANHIRVAHPYVPKTNGQWRTPVSVWGKTACEFFLQYDAGKPLAEQSINIRFNDSETMPLANKTFEERSRSVLITDAHGEHLTD